MRRAFALVVSVAVVVASAAVAQYNPGVPQKLPTYDKRTPVLLDDDAHILLTHLHNDYDGTQQTTNAASEDVDVFAGASALRVSPLQRHSLRIQGWSWKIVEKPTAEGEYRYIRFAWKKVGGEGIMIQIGEQTRNTWTARYYAGKNLHNWQPAMSVSDTVPKEWTVVTRDLWADFAKQYNGQPFVVTGMAFTALDGQHALFDHVVLGRSVAELDAVTDAALGRTKPGFSLDPKYREALWEDLLEKDRAKAGTAVRGLLSGAKEVVPLIAERLPQTNQSPEEVKDRAKRITTLVSQLGSDSDFDTRLAAEEALAKIGAAAEPAIRTALTSGDAEVRYRANRLMKDLKLEAGESPLPTRVAGRMVRILERANTDEAKALLKKMGDGIYGPEYLDPANAALARLK